MAKAQSALPAASKGKHEAIAYVRSPRIYTTEGKFLALFMACLLERAVGELPVVAMIMLNLYVVLGSKRLESTLGGNGLD
jgi:hypothetical protein